MTRDTKAEHPRERARRELAGKGWTAIVIGVLMLTVIPLFMRGPMASVFGQALRPMGWMALAIGAVLLWQLQPQQVQQQAVIGLGLGGSRQHEFTSIDGGHAHIHYRHRLKFGDDFRWRDATRQAAQLRLQADPQAVSQESHELG